MFMSDASLLANIYTQAAYPPFIALWPGKHAWDQKGSATSQAQRPKLSNGKNSKSNGKFCINGK